MFTKYLVRCLVSRNIISPEEESVYEYGMDAFVYTISSTLALLVIGTLIESFGATATIIAVFYTCQTFGGGYHAKTHLQCFSIMLFSLTAILVVPQVITFPIELLIILAVLSFFILFAMPIVIHPNKSYLRSRKKQFRHRSYIATSILLVIYATLCCTFLLAEKQGLHLSITVYTLSLVFSTISRMIGLLSTIRSLRPSQYDDHQVIRKR